MAQDGDAWRQPGARSSLVVMCAPRSRQPRRSAPAIVAAVLLALAPAVASAQSNWTGVGAINGTVMYMDTTTIVRTDGLRKVWIRSIDPAPKSFVAGTDTLDFDTVIGLNVFDCARHTRTVTMVRYLLGDEVVFNVPDTRGQPEPLKAGSFFDAVYGDLCGVRR